MADSWDRVAAAAPIPTLKSMIRAALARIYNNDCVVTETIAPAAAQEVSGVTP